MKKTIAVLLTVSVMIGIICQIAFAKEFSDLPSTHWAFEYIDKLSNQGVINGYEDGSYRPSNEVTRAEYIKLVTCAMGETEELQKLEKRYSMLPHDNWYDMYVYYAKVRGMLPSYYSDEELKSSIDREEMAFILNKACTYLGLNSKKDDEINYFSYGEDEVYKLTMEKMGFEYDEESNEYVQKDPNATFSLEELEKVNAEMWEFVNKQKYPFDDTRDLEDTSVLNINTVSKLGLIKGYEDGSFRPYNSLTRAEVATVIYRFINLTKEG